MPEPIESAIWRVRPMHIFFKKSLQAISRVIEVVRRKARVRPQGGLPLASYPLSLSSA